LIYLILENRKIFGFGDNQYGQLGLNDKLERNEPTELKSLENLDIDVIFIGYNHNIALSSSFLLKLRRRKTIFIWK
jgi:alpha-tubulin suppressor-like RCC1 family protein